MASAVISWRPLVLVICASVLHATVVAAFAPLPGLHSFGKLHEVRAAQRSVRRVGNFCMQATATARWTSDVIAKRRDAVSSDSSSDAAGSKSAGKKKLNKFFKTVKKPKGTISIVGEIKRKDPNDPDFSVNMPDPAECSKALHDSKVAAVAVWVDEELYGCSVDDLKETVAAQASFKGEFPGPCPVLACGVFVGPDQLQEAAKAGAAAVVLSVSVLEDELGNMIDCGKTAGVESVELIGLLALTLVVLCGSEGEVDQAVDAGATIVALDAKLLGVNSTIELIEKMGPKDGVVTAAFGGITDIADAWRLRDAGCNSVVVGSELLYAAYGKEGEVRQGGGKDGLGSSVVRGDVLQLNDVKAYARGLMAKASVKYASSSLNAFKEQGAGFKRHYTV